MQDRPLALKSGMAGLGGLVLLGIVFVMSIVVASSTPPGTFVGPLFILAAIGTAVGTLVYMCGFFVVSPNESKVVQLFGNYSGTISEPGFYWGNPFYVTTRVSRRVQSFETGQVTTPEKKDASGHVLETSTRHRQPSKVNDKDGTPIDIAAVVVWKVINAAEAVFAVKNYEEFVQMQSEAALRNLASLYPYDGHGEERSLRNNTKEVGEELKRELTERLQNAGVEILEARISFLAYSPEIAAAMLQRQQAAAVIAARQKIVEGAVGMVEMALAMLQEKQLVEFDADRKAAMVSNLLVILCGDRNPTPVVNTGSIYS
jgi:regulator of protease activity HflC (stomatin/prohibitin superfamily)